MIQFLRNLWGKASAVGHVLPMLIGRPAFPPRNYQNFSKEAYQLNIIAYRCISLISTAAASVPWLLYDGEDEVVDHDIVKLLRRPNPMQSGRELFTALYAYDLLIGDSYLERIVLGGGKLAELYTLRPDRIKVVPGRFGVPLRFEYSLGQGNPHIYDVDPITVASDVMHVRRFNPLNDIYGQSPVEAAGMSIDSHNEATRWNYAVLKNGARPSGALEYGDREMDDENFDRLKTEIETNYSGNSRGRPMLLQGGLKWVQMMLTQMDLDWAKGKETSAREIAIAYSVPEQLVGVPGQQTFNNYREARLALYEDAVLPILDRYSEALTNWLSQLPGYEGLRIGYDVDQIPAMSIRREQQWERVNAAKFLSVDEKRQALGYGNYEPDESNPASIIFVTASEIPLSMATVPFDQSQPTEETPDTGEVDPDIEQTVNETAVAEGADVQSLAMNGAQIAAALQLIQAVADGMLPPESAIALIRVAFPTVDEATAQAMIQPAVEFLASKPEEEEDEEGDENDDVDGNEDEEDDEQQPPKPTEKELTANVVKALIKQHTKGQKALFKKAHQLAYGGKGKK